MCLPSPNRNTSLPLLFHCWQKTPNKRRIKEDVASHPSLLLTKNQIQKYKEDAAPLPPPPQPWWTRPPASLLLGDPLPAHQHHQGVRPGNILIGEISLQIEDRRRLTTMNTCSDCWTSLFSLLIREDITHKKHPLFWAKIAPPPSIFCFSVMASPSWLNMICIIFYFLWYLPPKLTMIYIFYFLWWLPY